MVLNWTNISRIALVTGQEHTDGWTGKMIVLFNDKAVMYKGKLTGGIRVQVPVEPTTDVVDSMPIRHQTEPDAPEPEDDIPF